MNEIFQIQPDIIALQEVNQSINATVVDTDCIRCGKCQIKSDNHAMRIVNELKKRGINYHWSYLPVKVGYQKYDEGLAVLCKYPILDAHEILLSQQDDYNNWRTRKALVVKLGDKIGYVCNVHMGWWDDEADPYKQQWERLESKLPDGKIWLMGDFNSPDSKKDEGYDLIRSGGWTDLYREYSSDCGYTVPGSIDGWKGCAPKRIDYIWHNGKVNVLCAKVCFSDKCVSDHFGVFAEVDIQANSKNRASGILLPIFSLPSKYGIGCFDKCAYQFVDFLADSGQKYWQILPLGSTGFGDSPYQSFSSFAGNPYFISLEDLIEQGLLDKEICDKTDFGSDSTMVDYQKLYHNRFVILNYAYKKWNENSEYNEFCNANKYWLDDYSLFMAIKDSFDGKPWYMWDKDIKTRECYAVEKYKQRLYDIIEFYKFIQFVFFNQWQKLKSYANNKGIKLIGDIPIYASMDSCDCWVNPELFQFDSNLQPIAVAGCPPDGFSPKGQLWGNPLYDWEQHKKTNYSWWATRIAFNKKLYDILRIDHFRGFDEYYSIPFNSLDATTGKWEQGPGYHLFETFQKLGLNDDFIAEDLGFLTDSVKDLIIKCGFPGMKILQFAFDSRDDSSNEHKPYNYNNNCVVYTGTHDNNTLCGWLQSIGDDELAYLKEFLNTDDCVYGMIKCAMSSVADMCIIPMYDYLSLGDIARINTPSTTGNNWKWRLNDLSFAPALSAKICSLTKMYGRI